MILFTTMPFSTARTKTDAALQRPRRFRPTTSASSCGIFEGRLASAPGIRGGKGGMRGRWCHSIRSIFICFGGGEGPRSLCICPLVTRCSSVGPSKSLYSGYSDRCPDTHHRGGPAHKSLARVSEHASCHCWEWVLALFFWVFMLM